MINRIIIRSKVLQIVYAQYQRENVDLKLAEKELLFSLQKSYDLYHDLLLLIPHITNVHQKRVDLRKHKYLPSEEEKNPNTRFIKNRFSEQLKRNYPLSKFFNEKGSFWTEESEFVKKLLDQIIESQEYTDYLQTPDDYESDREFWRKIFKQFICGNESLEELLEDRSLYWNDDIEIIETFVLKTIKRFEEQNGMHQDLLPMYKEIEDQTFAINLLKQTFLQGEDHRKRIMKHIDNWDVERVANIDMYIMQMAIAEFLTFPSIPVNVTLNEYIDLAKYYSTPKSGMFINGILDAIASDLKEEKILLK